MKNYCELTLVVIYHPERTLTHELPPKSVITGMVKNMIHKIDRFSPIDSGNY